MLLPEKMIDILPTQKNEAILHEVVGYDRWVGEHESAVTHKMGPGPHASTGT
jgi:hypothetical protein